MRLHGHISKRCYTCKISIANLNSICMTREALRRSLSLRFGRALLKFSSDSAVLVQIILFYSFTTPESACSSRIIQEKCLGQNEICCWFLGNLYFLATAVACRTAIISSASVFSGPGFILKLRSISCNCFALASCSKLTADCAHVTNL